MRVLRTILVGLVALVAAAPPPAAKIGRAHV